MSDLLSPAVSFEDGPVPRWTHYFVDKAARRLGHPECVLVAQVKPLMGWMTPLPDPWDCASFLVDWRLAGVTQRPALHGFAVGLAAGPHTFGVEPHRQQWEIEPVTLVVPPGAVVVIEGRTKDYRPGTVPTMTIQVVRCGFAQSGRRGHRSARRLGWAVPGGPPSPVREDAGEPNGGTSTVAGAAADAAMEAFAARVVAEGRRRGVDVAPVRPDCGGGWGGAGRVNVMAGRNVLSIGCRDGGPVSVAASVMPDAFTGRVNTRPVDLPRDAATIGALVALLGGAGEFVHRWTRDDEFVVGKGRSALALPVAVPDTTTRRD